MTGKLALQLLAVAFILLVAKCGLPHQLMAVGMKTLQHRSGLHTPQITMFVTINWTQKMVITQLIHKKLTLLTQLPSYLNQQV
jgi:hypothetical protein